MTRRALATSAVRRAGTLRARLGYGPADAVCPFDIATRIDVEVRFVGVPSLEGMYEAQTSTVIINSLRPAGRRRYTCGHELGHHLHGHGTSFDGAGEFVADRTEEFVANHFARALLMPKLAVAAAFNRRGWSVADVTAEQAFIVAQDLGVGFTTLLDQMSVTLHLLDRTVAVQLSKTRPQQLRERLMPGGAEHDVVPVDRHWGARPLDLEVGDVVLCPSGTHFDGACVERDGTRLRASTPGRGELRIAGRTDVVPVRVSRREFVGRARFRHLEEVDDE